MKIQFQRIDHVQICIPVGMENEARKFYCDILGMTEVEKPAALKPNGGFWLSTRDIQLHIGTEEMTGKSKRHPAFEVKNLDSVKKYLIEQGVQIKEDTPVPHVNRFSIFDPWGNRIELLEYK